MLCINQVSQDVRPGTSAEMRKFRWFPYSIPMAPSMVENRNWLVRSERKSVTAAMKTGG
jgi:hypothetical protein